jgi:antitoxin (DNA-binding transcriptional repressor) of toxin-antitoxin stability system
MKPASIRDLRYGFRRIERLLHQGEEVQITRRRRVIARLVPEHEHTATAPMPDFLERLPMQASAEHHYITVFGELEMGKAMELRVFRQEVTPAQAHHRWGTARMCAGEYSGCARLRTRSSSARTGCRLKPAHALKPAPRTWSTLPPPLKWVSTRSTASINNSGGGRRRSG